MDNICFDDVLLIPQWSNIKSRADVSLKTTLMGVELNLPVISSNMDTVTDYKMANAMTLNGGIGCLHRFMSVQDNIEHLDKSPRNTIASVGIGSDEFDRAQQLFQNGARLFCIDVAHAASDYALEQYVRMKRNFSGIRVMVGNFATASTIQEFVKKCQQEYGVKAPDAFKVGVGGGSVCLTRVVTGHGLPTLTSVIDCVKTGYPIVADGGIRNSGDIAKALASGATAVMLGGVLAGTDETPGEVELSYENGSYLKRFKKYRGSASKESYQVQGKTASHRVPEGESTFIEAKGPVADVLEGLGAGLRSALTYSGAKNLEEFVKRAQFVEVSLNTVKESGAHGKK